MNEKSVGPHNLVIKDFTVGGYENMSNIVNILIDAIDIFGETPESVIENLEEEEKTRNMKLNEIQEKIRHLRETIELLDFKILKAFEFAPDKNKLAKNLNILTTEHLQVQKDLVKANSAYKWMSSEFDDFLSKKEKTTIRMKEYSKVMNLYNKCMKELDLLQDQINTMETTGDLSELKKLKYLYDNEKQIVQISIAEILSQL